MPGTSLGESRSMRPASSDSAALLDGVVVSPRHGFAYVMRPGGGLVAVNLANGKVSWRSEKGAKPVALVGDRLLAQADTRGKGLELVALDARSGAVRESVRIPLPAGVSATVVDTAKGSFRVQAGGAGSDLLVRWEATGFGVPAQGYLPAADESQAPAAEVPSIVAGEAVLDVASLAVKAEPSVRVSRSAAIARAALEELSAPAVAGGGRQVLSADGRHVLVTEAADAADFTLHRYRWTIYERDSGTRLGSVPAMVSAVPFVVVGNTLYHTVPAHAVRKDGKFVEAPTSLRAVNLKGGVEAWKVALLETSFRGPFPP